FTTSSAGCSLVSAPSSEAPTSFTTTLAPCRASSMASARPRPRPAPVTMATLPSSAPTSARDQQPDGVLQVVAHLPRVLPPADPREQRSEPHHRQHPDHVGLQLLAIAERGPDDLGHGVVDVARGLEGRRVV